MKNLKQLLNHDSSIIDYGKSIYYSQLVHFLGAFCRHCHSTKKECNTIDIVRNGFRFTRDIHETIELYELITGNMEGVDIKLIEKDSHRRQGLL